MQLRLIRPVLPSAAALLVLASCASEPKSNLDPRLQEYYDQLVAAHRMSMSGSGQQPPNTALERLSSTAGRIMAESDGKESEWELPEMPDSAGQPDIRTALTAFRVSLRDLKMAGDSGDRAATEERYRRTMEAYRRLAEAVRKNERGR